GFWWWGTRVSVQFCSVRDCGQERLSKVDEGKADSEGGNHQSTGFLGPRTGNAIGTLAFTWATVVLLGGYPSVLRPDEDFLYATTIIFVEAARNSLDINFLAQIYHRYR
uniref:Uncharacterized protein n=1 Tax=Oryza glaberrima TaxID=4538 RepID=I1QCR9_ORYGL